MSVLGKFAAAAVIAASLAGAAALAQGPGPGRRGPGGFDGPGGPAALGAMLPLRELNLTEAQQQQVRDIVERYREQNQSALEQLRAAMETERKAFGTFPIDEGLIRSTVQGRVQAETELAIQRARLTNEVFALLTAAQQEQLRKVQADRASRIEQRQQQQQQRPRRQAQGA